MDKKKLLPKYELVPLRHFDMDDLKYEITKISRRKCIYHLHDGNEGFKIVVWTNTEKYS